MALLEIESLVEVDDTDVYAGLDAEARARLAEVTLAELHPGLLLVEAKHWNAKDHPRWPKGTPRAGEFMKIGQRFVYKGGEYEVALNMRGKIVANRATGKVHDAGQIVLTGEQASDGGLHIPGVEAAPPRVIKGGKTSTVTVVDPYVDSGSHDASLKIPSNAPPDMTAERWKRFGRVDQEHYIDLMSRFGKWSPGGAQSLHNAAYKEYEHDIQGLVKSAFKSQYDASSGYTLSLTGLLKSLMPGQPGLKKAIEKRERAKELQGDLMAVVQWDLYNRTASPDLTCFHKSSDSPAYWQEFIDGKKAIFSGLSQSFHYRGSFFGGNALATPVAIRHILMSTYSAQPVPGEQHFPGELEVSVPEQMRLDKRSFSFNRSSSSGPQSITPSQEKWLTGVTKAPQGGAVLEQFAEARKGNAELPIPPAPPNIIAHGAGGKQWIDPPAGAAEATKGYPWPAIGGVLDPAALPKDLPWAFKGKDGTPVATVANESGFNPGDYMIGLKGTLYYIISDPGDSSGFGLRYVKIVNGAFTGESYNFEGAGGNKYYKLDPAVMHTDPPKPPSTKDHKPWEPGGWVAGQGEQFVGKLKKGAKFKVSGNGYELVDDGSMSASTVQVKSLDTGKLATINTDYKTAVLVPKSGYTPPEPEPEAAADAIPAAAKPKEHHGFAVGEKVHVTSKTGKEFDAVVTGSAMSSKGHALVKISTASGKDYSVYPHRLTSLEPPVAGEGAPAPKKAEPGDVFPHEGKKYTVTSVLKNGTINAKPQGGGKVEQFQPDEDLIAKLHRPSDWEMNPAEHVKLGDLQIGDLFHGGLGQTPKPYKVVGKGPGAKVSWANLETGQTGKATVNKTVVPIAHKSAPGEGVAKGQPKHTPAAPGAGPFDASQYTEGKPTPVEDTKVGDVLLSKTGQPYVVVKNNANAKHVVTKSLIHGKPYPIIKGSDITPLAPKADQAIAYEDLTPGDLVQLGALKKGDTFSTSGEGSNVYVVVSPSATSSETNAIVAILGADGLPGQKTATDTDPGKLVVFAAKKADVATPLGAPSGTSAEYPDVSTAPGGFAPYKSATSGKAGVGKGLKHNVPIGTMPVGALFRDKNGTEWLVKQTGAHAVISDGEKNYSVASLHKGQIVEDPQLIDGAPPVGVEEPAKQHAREKATEKVHALPSAFKPGMEVKIHDPEEVGATTAIVVGPGEGTDIIIEMPNGTHLAYQPHELTPLPGDPGAGAAAPPLSDFLPNIALKVGDLKPGDWFSVGGTPWQVVGGQAFGGNSVEVKQAGGGTTWLAAEAVPSQVYQATVPAKKMISAGNVGWGTTVEYEGGYYTALGDAVTSGMAVLRDPLGNPIEVPHGALLSVLDQNLPEFTKGQKVTTPNGKKATVVGANKDGVLVDLTGDLDLEVHSPFDLKGGTAPPKAEPASVPKGEEHPPAPAAPEGQSPVGDDNAPAGSTHDVQLPSPLGGGLTSPGAAALLINTEPSADVVAEYMGGLSDEQLKALIAAPTPPNEPGMDAVKLAAQAEVDLRAEEAMQAAADAPSPTITLKSPYWYASAHGTGGKVYYPPITGLKAGESFQDKKGNKYEFVKHDPASAHVHALEHSTGSVIKIAATFKTPKGDTRLTRVRLLPHG